MIATIRAKLLALVAASLLGRAYAQTSLYVPGFDPQPLAVSELGAGSDGRTTWEIKAGVPSGTFSEAGFSGTVTLVEGPSDAHLIYTHPVDGYGFDEKCVISGGIADCRQVVVTGGRAETFPHSESAVPIEVQSPGATPAPTGGASSPSKSTGDAIPSQTSNMGSNSNRAAVTLPSLGLVVLLGGIGFTGF